MSVHAPVQWIGRLGYRWAHRLQHARRRAVIAGRAPEVLWLLEHSPVVTLGRRGGEVLGVPRGVPVVATERGGLATVHVPGQLVGYLILDLTRHGLGVREAVWRLEQGLIDWLGSRGISATRRSGFPGVWVGGAKIAALGIHVRRGVTMHGFALNLDPDLAAFRWVVACGIEDAQTTSVAGCGGGHLTPAQVADEVGAMVWAALVDTPSEER